MDRALVNRYAMDLPLKRIYVDLDDTLLLRGKVNLALIRLVYQCLNRGVAVVLVTRHEGNLDETLQRQRLTGLFDRIVHLKQGEPKSAAIDDPNCHPNDPPGRDIVQMTFAGSVPAPTLRPSVSKSASAACAESASCCDSTT